MKYTLTYFAFKSFLFGIMYLTTYNSSLVNVESKIVFEYIRYQIPANSHNVMKNSQNLTFIMMELLVYF